MQIHSDYLGKVYDPSSYRKLIRRSVAAARKLQQSLSFEAIAFTGTSGAAMAFPLSGYLNIPLICVRKPDNGHHSSTYQGIRGTLEGAINAKSYLIVDDFISSGETIQRIVERIAFWNKMAICKGILLYRAEQKVAHYEMSLSDQGFDPIPKIFVVKNSDLGFNHRAIFYPPKGA